MADDTIHTETDPLQSAEPETPLGLPSAELKAIVEALVFASPEPLTPKMLFKLLASEPREDIVAAIDALRADYENRPGLQWLEVAGGCAEGCSLMIAVVVLLATAGTALAMGWF